MKKLFAITILGFLLAGCTSSNLATVSPTSGARETKNVRVQVEFSTRSIEGEYSQTVKNGEKLISSMGDSVLDKDGNNSHSALMLVKPGETISIVVTPKKIVSKKVPPKNSCRIIEYTEKDEAVHRPTASGSILDENSATDLSTVSCTWTYKG